MHDVTISAVEIVGDLTSVKLGVIDELPVGVINRLPFYPDTGHSSGRY